LKKQLTIALATLALIAATGASVSPIFVKSAAADSGIPDSTQDVAQMLVDYQNQGKLTTVPSTIFSGEIAPAATGSATANCAVDKRIYQIIAHTIQKYGSATVTAIQRPCIGSSLNCGAPVYSLHCRVPGLAVDFSYIGGKGLNGSDPTSISFLQDLNTYVPSGTQVGQADCRLAAGNSLSLSNIRQFNDGCNHQHVDLGSTSAPLRLPGTASDDKASVTPPVALGKNDSGNMEVFSRANNGIIYHSWATDAKWSDWQTAAANPSSGVTLQAPVVVSNDVGSEELFSAGSDGVVYHNWAPDWAAWVPLANQPANVTFSKVFAGRNQNNKQEVYAVGNNGLVYNAWDSTSGWQGWSLVSGNPSNVRFSDVRMVQNDTKFPELFAAGSDGSIYHNWGSTGGWSGWVKIAQSPAGVAFTSVSTSRNKAGKQEIFATGSNGLVYNAWDTSSGWQGWANLSSNPSNATFKDVSVSVNDGGYQELFAAGSNGAIYHNWNGANGWSGWVQVLPNPASVGFTTVAVTKNTQGKQEIFATGTNSLIYHAWDTISGWNGWLTVAPNPDGVYMDH
jgi:hypothetical protein